ncbi:MAG: hypothetical protein ACYS22_13320, partial [Planctomycetota bacterium]
GGPGRIDFTLGRGNTFAETGCRASFSFRLFRSSLFAEDYSATICDVTGALFNKFGDPLFEYETGEESLGNVLSVNGVIYEGRGDCP